MEPMDGMNDAQMKKLMDDSVVLFKIYVVLTPMGPVVACSGHECAIEAMPEDMKKAYEDAVEVGVRAIGEVLLQHSNKVAPHTMVEIKKEIDEAHAAQNAHDDDDFFTKNNTISED